MKKGSLIVAALVIFVIVFTMLFSLQRLIDMRVSGLAPLEKEKTVYDASSSR
ncbi:MAG: hypothetical protein ACK4E2_01355 [Pseudothermotoga sp.]